MVGLAVGKVQKRRGRWGAVIGHSALSVPRIDSRGTGHVTTPSGVDRDCIEHCKCNLLTFNKMIGLRERISKSHRRSADIVFKLHAYFLYHQEQGLVVQ